MEIQDRLTEGERRLQLRERVRKGNKALLSAAKNAGVSNFPSFQDAGYRGLYGGLGVREIKRLKNIPKNDHLLDRAGRAELAANEFRITQTEQKLVREKVKGQTEATETHREVGKEVRQTIQKIGGTMPENLIAEPSIKLIERQRKHAKKLRDKKSNQD
jgi:DNA-damage-inducible protein D